MNTLLLEGMELTPNNILGTWYNQRGSILDILKISSNGLVEGYYLSPVGTNGEKFPLNGVINCPPPLSKRNHDIVISFTVKWGKYGSITSWVGFFEKTDEVIYINTKWHLATALKFTSENSISTSTDIFAKDQIPACQRPRHSNFWQDQ